jgi:DNA-binding PadR family transcriptional regulator
MMTEDYRRVDGFLPLTPANFAILLTLVGGEKHGYAIMREVESSRPRTVRLGPGTLYRSIKQLLTMGLIEESGERPDPALDDERRRYYGLTALGQRVVQAEAMRLAQLVSQAEAKGLLSGYPPAGAMQPGTGGAL